MKNLILVLVVSAFFVLSGCQKNETTAAGPDLTTSWVGTYNGAYMAPVQQIQINKVNNNTVQVIIKQLHDFQGGQRASTIMQALARGLSDTDITDLAAYYAYLPKARNAATTYADALPALVRVGAPMRNIAPCIACHGSVDQKLGAPWLEGMPKAYLVTQLKSFRSGARRNDSHAQMRNMARAMSDAEILGVADFYAGRGLPSAAR